MSPIITLEEGEITKTPPDNVAFKGKSCQIKVLQQ
jgi:hypothetical protein